MAVIIDVGVALKELADTSPTVPMLLTLNEKFEVQHFVTLGDSVPILERALETGRLSRSEADYWQQNLREYIEGPTSWESASRLRSFAQTHLRFELLGPFAITRDAAVKLEVGLKTGPTTPLVFMGHVTEIWSIQQHGR